ncbi:LOW QUALITY PROTEIN: cocaine esterase-like [Biomphalaria glabrata]|uniref:Carboxylic ester hydrolase n=1 Tax=Biomphalaria glabrata TaxID=6526 RepID=A0A9U8EBA8_BIOGL|nr:LOW QUALITY PROTEIN: cocaine esterase-like [Biomphalaria glabrata]
MVTVILFLCLLNGAYGHENVLAKTNYGIVKGTSSIIDNKAMFCYLGVPYAKPPTGPRRFKQPEPPNSWSGVRDAVTLGPKCPQLDELDPFDPTPISEDCLNLNIYSPTEPTSQGTAPSTSLLPVMVWIHGGSFSMGSGSKYNGSVLASRGVVVVTVNYRLDILGFLSTADSIIPGNFGLLDQIMALQWIQANIQFFGGDPQMVTIFGESSGAACVSLLVLSPLSKGLFQRAILESGSPLAYWSITYPVNKIQPDTIAQSIASKLNCTQLSSTEILVCLQKVNVFDLINASTEYRKSNGLVFIPRVEALLRSLPDYPLKILRSGNFNHVDTIQGYNSDEGWYFLNTSSAQLTREGFRESIHNLMTSLKIMTSDSIVDQFEEVYIKKFDGHEFNFRQGLRAVSDFVFIAPIVMETMLAETWSRDSKHYLYEFQYRPSDSEMPPFVGAVHGNEQAFLFRSFDNDQFWNTKKGHTQADLLISDEMMAFWSSFAKHGSPNGNMSGLAPWVNYTPDRPNCLKINILTTLSDHGKQLAVQIYKPLIDSLMNEYPVTVVG